MATPSLNRYISPLKPNRILLQVFSKRSFMVIVVILGAISEGWLYVRSKMSIVALRGTLVKSDLTSKETRLVAVVRVEILTRASADDFTIYFSLRYGRITSFRYWAIS